MIGVYDMNGSFTLIHLYFPVILLFFSPMQPLFFWKSVLVEKYKKIYGTHIVLKLNFFYFSKARNVEYKDPVEEEWERFQKEIKEETDLSARMINDDTEDATVQRQIEQIDEQMTRLSKLVWSNIYFLFKSLL